MRAYLARLGELQSAIILALTYLVVVLPVWMMLRLAGRPLLADHRPDWHTPESGRSLEELRLPY